MPRLDYSRFPDVGQIKIICQGSSVVERHVEAVRVSSSILFPGTNTKYYTMPHPMTSDSVLLPLMGGFDSFMGCQFTKCFVANLSKLV